MRDFNSVAGNAWRGFAPSAEFIGEFLCNMHSCKYFLNFVKTRNRIIFVMR